MASFSTTASLLLLVLSVSFDGSFSQNLECSGLIYNMVECLSYVTIGSTVNAPEGSCCTGLKTVLDTKAVCLCDMLRNSGSMGIKLNVTRASTLPAACKLTAPPASACALSPTSPPTNA